MVFSLIPSLLYHSIQNPKIEFKVQHRKLVSRPSNSKMIHIVGIIKQGLKTQT